MFSITRTLVFKEFNWSEVQLSTNKPLARNREVVSLSPAQSLLFCAFEKVIFSQLNVLKCGICGKNIPFMRSIVNANSSLSICCLIKE